MPRNHTKLASQRRDENISSCLRVLFVCFLFFKEYKFNMHFDSGRQSPGSYLFTSGASEQCRLSGTHRITKAFSLNLLWDAVQIWRKSYILFPRTWQNLSPKWSIHHALEFLFFPYSAFFTMNSSLTLPSIWKVCSGLLFLQMKKFHLASIREIGIDSNLNRRSSHKFFLVASTCYFKKTDHPLVTLWSTDTSPCTSHPPGVPSL